MQVTYQSLCLDLPYPVVQVVEVRRQEGLNRHAYLQVTAIIEEETIEEYFHQMAEGQKISAGLTEQGETTFFVGYLDTADVFFDKGQAMLSLTAVSFTKKWDIVKRQRSFQNLDFSYSDIIDQVLSGYENKSWIGKVDTSKKISGLILQYNETDWEFLCRLASHFGTYLMADPCSEAGQVYFGLPEVNLEHTVEGNNYTIIQDMQRFQTYTQNTSQEIMMQDNLGWEVTARISYKLGEQVMWNHVACQVTALVMETKEAEVWYTYRLERKDGVKAQFYGNQLISGLSLPARIKERNGNCLRVQFCLDKEYKSGNNVYFTFAIETTSWYCLPEEGSMVHIYFSNWDESSAIAVHAMRLSEGAGSSKSVSAKGAVADKSFSTSDGKAMKFTDNGIMFVSDEDEASTITLCSDGSLNIDGKDIVVGTPLLMELGKAMVIIDDCETEVITKNMVLECQAGVAAMGILIFSGEEVTLAEDKGIVLTKDGEAQLVITKTLSYIGEQKDPPGVQYSDEQLKEQDKQQRDDHNREVFEAREREAKSKLTVGTVVAGAGLLIVVAAATVLTGGVATVAIVAGATAYYCGAAQMAEAATDLSKISSGDFSQSYNAIRDGICGGNQAIYNAVMYGSVMIGASLVLAPLGAKLGVIARGFMQAGMTGTLSATTMFLGDVSDGYIDASFKDYLLDFGRSAATAGFGYAIGALGAAAGENIKIVNDILKKAGKYAPALIIGAETLLDVGVDWATSKIFDTDFNLGQSVLINLASNIAFSIDPVNVANGSFSLEATDLSLPDLLCGRFAVKRFYNSVLSCEGNMGKNWMLNLESRLFLHEEEQRINVLCMDGHMERFYLEDNVYKNRRQGDQRYRLEKLPGDEGFILLYVPEQKRYFYDSMGRLMSVQGNGNGRMMIEYLENHISRVITSAGYVLEFLYENDRIVEIRDELGRTIRYKYENDYLKAVCHVDEGVTTYHYDENHYISQVIDQNGHAYVMNEYDGNGRVVTQHYLDGSKSTLEYNPEKRENTIYVEALGRTERYCYDRQFLITNIIFEDGTVSEVGYDEWTNKIYEKDRNGNVIRRCYNAFGNLLREELPSGQVWEYEYDDSQQLIEKRANTGQKYRYRYNEYGFLCEEHTKVCEGAWKRRYYERDFYGRVTKETDSRQNPVQYVYQSHDGHLLVEPTQVTDALGQRTIYEYDKAGRRISITTEYGTVDLRYNKQNYITYVSNGNGNVTRRTYDKMGNLTALFPANQGADGYAWMYRYDFFDRLVEVRDPLGSVWKKERNLAGDILREIHPCGYLQAGENGFGTKYEYDTESRRIRTIYPDGSVDRYFYDSNGNLVKRVRPESYDGKNDDGKGSCYQYDEMNRLKQIIDEEGIVQKVFSYDSSGNRTEETDAAGYTTYHSYDLIGNRIATWTPLEEDGQSVLYRVTRFEYDTESNLICEKRGRDKAPKGKEAVRYHELYYTYDSLNRLAGVKDRYGAKVSYRYNCLNQRTYESFRISNDVKKVTVYEYDAAGNLIEKRERLEERFLKARGTEKAIWAVTQYEYDKNGNCTQVISPKGYQTKRWYDALDRMIKEEQRDKTSGIRRIYRYEYDAAGNLLKRMDGSLEEMLCRREYQYDKKDRLTHFVDEEGAMTRLFYDKNDRVRKVVRPEQYEEQKDDGIGLSYTYNCHDQVLEITDADGMPLNSYTYDRTGNISSVWEGGSVYTEYSYNLTGDPMAVYTGTERARKKQAVQTFEYDAQGNITGVVDGNQNQTQFVLDDWGRITEIYTPEGSVERYAYDFAGNITGTTDANGGTITYRYNSFGQVSEIVDQAGASEFFYYDEEGRPELHIDRNGNQVRTHYNMDNRLLYQRGEDAKGRNAVTNQYAYYPNGRLKEAVGGGISYQYDYTATGLLQQKASSGKSLLGYTYDKNGNLTELANVMDMTTRYCYDGMDRLRQVSDGSSKTPLAVYDYTAGNRVRSLSYGNGVKTTYDYADDGQMKSLVSVASDGRVLLDYHYAYDGNGNHVAKSGEKYHNEYAYDKMNRLIEAVYNGSKEWYAYDLAGNRIRKETEHAQETYCYNVKNQLIRLEQDTGVTCYAYDKQGNMVSEENEKEARSYHYNAFNMQTALCVDDKEIQSHYYDGENLRYETEENGKIIRFLFDRGELAVEEQESRWKGYSRGYQVIAAQAEQEEWDYYLSDEMGSTVFLLDREQNIKKSYRYDAFGSIIETTGSIENRITYTGQMYDGVSGQYYLRARFYNPVLGRFTQEDVHRGDGLNLYTYCHNNPVVYYDPSGYFALCINKGTPRELTEEEISRMIEFPGDVVHPETVSANNPDGIFSIRATGDYVYDRMLLAEAAGISNPDPNKWISHHIDYDPNTNTMAMQFVSADYHSYSHFGGAAVFERSTGFKYGSTNALNEARNRNISYLLGLLKH